MRLTLRTLLAYLDDTLPPDQARAIGLKVAESDTARELIDRIRKVTRRRSLSTPTADLGPVADPNTVADYLSDKLTPDQIADFEEKCLSSDVLLAEVAACHQILTLLLSEPVRVPPTARQRMYQLVKGRESIPNRKPGNTVPVAGELPEPVADEADDLDAPLLLGLRAYSRSEPWRKRAVPLAAVVAVFLALFAAIYLALSGTTIPTTDTLNGAVAQAVIVLPPSDGRQKSADQNDRLEVGPQPRPAEGNKDDLNLPTKKDQTPNTTEKPAVPPGELVPVTDEPRQGRVIAAKLENPDAVVVTRTENDAPWLRVTAQEPDIMTLDRVVALPGYKARLRIDPAVELELWGNLPELQRIIPVLESAVTFYQPVDGFHADFAIQTGRVYITAKQPTGAKVRLRVRDEVWDLTLPDDKSQVVVEVINGLVRGMSRSVDPSERPQTEIVLAVLQGTAGLKVRYKEIPKIQENEGVSWTSKGPGLEGPTKLGSAPPFQPPTYYSRFELPVGDDAKAAREALADLANRASGRDSIRVALAELLRDDMNYSRQRIVGAKLAVYGRAALGDLAPVIDALNESTGPFAWDIRQAAEYALSATLATTTDGVQRFRQQLADKLLLSEQQADLAVRLLRGPDDTERQDPEVLDQLVEALSNNWLVIRELAFRALQKVSDPSNPPARAALLYNAAGMTPEREVGVRAWRLYIEELKKKSLDPKEPDKP